MAEIILYILSKPFSFRRSEIIFLKTICLRLADKTFKKKLLFL